MSNATQSIKHRDPGTPAKDALTEIRWRGYMDAMNGNGFPREYDASWKRHQQINYERGRHQWAGLQAATHGNAPVWPRNALLTTVWRRMMGTSKGLIEFKGSQLPYKDRPLT